MSGSDLAAFHITVSGQVTSGNSRIKGISAVGGAALSSVALRNGGSSGTVVFTLDIPATTAAVVQLSLPQNGIWCHSGIYATVTGSPTGITIVTEGNA